MIDNGMMNWMGGGMLIWSILGIVMIVSLLVAIFTMLKK